MFMQEMIQLSKLQQQQEQDVMRTERIVQIISSPLFGSPELLASPAQFGGQLDFNEKGIEAKTVITSPLRACSHLDNPHEIFGKIAIVERSDCMFQEKARFAQAAGAVGVIVIDHFEDTSAAESPFFAMSGDGSQDDDIKIPVVFLFKREGNLLLNALKRNPAFVVRMAEKSKNPARLFTDYLKNFKVRQLQPISFASSLNNGRIESPISCIEIDKEVTCFSQATDLSRPSNGKKECVRDGTAEICMQRVGDQLITVRRQLPTVPNLRPIAVVDNRIGQRHIKFHFDLPVSAASAQNSLEEKGRLVDGLIQRFAAETNVNTLSRGSSYIAVARKLAYMSFGLSAPLGDMNERILADMMSELVVKQPPSMVGAAIKNSMKCSLSDDGAVECAKEAEDN